jgi:hypothetical protein
MGRERKATIVDGSGDGSAIYKIFLALKVCLVWGATLVFFHMFSLTLPLSSQTGERED